MTNLTPTPVVDKNGRATTVHKNLNPAPTAAGRLGKVSAAPDKLPIRAIRDILKEAHPNIEGNRLNMFVKRSVDGIMPILEGKQKFYGKLSDALAQHMGSYNSAKSGDMARRIVDVIGREDEKMDNYYLPKNAEYNAKDEEALNVIYGEATKTVQGKVGEYSEPFYLSQILNRDASKTEEDPTMLGSYYSFEYMGSSEYEWGAIPKSRERIVNAPELQYTVQPFTFGGVTRDVHFIGSDVSGAVAYLKKQEVEGDLNIRNKAGSGLNDAFIAGSSYKTNAGQTAWWALNSDEPDFFYTLDADRAEDVARVMHRAGNKKQKFVKVNVEVVI